MSCQEMIGTLSGSVKSRVPLIFFYIQICLIKWEIIQMGKNQMENRKNFTRKINDHFLIDVL